MHVYCLDIQSSQFSLAIKFQVLSRSKGHQPGYSMHQKAHQIRSNMEEYKTWKK